MKRDPMILYVLVCLSLFFALAAFAFAGRANKEAETNRNRTNARLERVDDLNRQMAGIRAIVACLSTVTVGEGQAVVVMNPSCLR